MDSDPPSPNQPAHYTGSEFDPMARHDEHPPVPEAVSPSSIQNPMFGDPAGGLGNLPVPHQSAFGESDGSTNGFEKLDHPPDFDMHGYDAPPEPQAVFGSDVLQSYPPGDHDVQHNLGSDHFGAPVADAVADLLEPYPPQEPVTHQHAAFTDDNEQMIGQVGGGDDYEPSRTPERDLVDPIDTGFGGIAPMTAVQEEVEQFVRKTPSPPPRLRSPSPPPRERTPSPPPRQRTPSPVRQPSPPPRVRTPSPPPVARPAPSSFGGDTSSSGGGCCFDLSLKGCDPRVADILLWRDPKKTGPVFGAVLLLLIALRCMSIISLVCWVGLLALASAIGFRVYKSVVAAVQKKTVEHPLKDYLDKEVQLPTSKIHGHVDDVIRHVECSANKLRRALAMNDITHSLKVAGSMYMLMRIGRMFSEWSLALIGVLLVFSVPKVYDMHKAKIDEHVGKARDKISEVYKQVEEKVPFLKKKAQ